MQRSVITYLWGEKGGWWQLPVWILWYLMSCRHCDPGLTPPRLWPCTPWGMWPQWLVHESLEIVSLLLLRPNSFKPLFFPISHFFTKGHYAPVDCWAVPLGWSVHHSSSVQCFVTVSHSLLTFGTDLAAIKDTEVVSSVWCEVGGAQLEKGDVMFLCTSHSQQHLNQMLITVVGLFAYVASSVSQNINTHTVHTLSDRFIMNNDY